MLYIGTHRQSLPTTDGPNDVAELRALSRRIQRLVKLFDRRREEQGVPHFSRPHTLVKRFLS